MGRVDYNAKMISCDQANPLFRVTLYATYPEADQTRIAARFYTIDPYDFIFKGEIQSYSELERAIIEYDKDAGSKKGPKQVFFGSCTVHYSDEKEAQERVFNEDLIKTGEYASKEEAEASFEEVMDRVYKVFIKKSKTQQVPTSMWTEHCQNFYDNRKTDQEGYLQNLVLRLTLAKRTGRTTEFDECSYELLRFGLETLYEKDAVFINERIRQQDVGYEDKIIGLILDKIWTVEFGDYEHAKRLQERITEEIRKEKK